ncbi:hypothetical protein MKX08_000014 [Trichoderma sp. CBMAI-0020]|nr:hypothetical protein MKX08_000014 [Trichoderma sp. CBMAI-0020]
MVNMLKSRVEDALRASYLDRHEGLSLRDLRFIKNVLDEHSAYLEEIHASESMNMESSATNNKKAIGNKKPSDAIDATQKELLEDYRCLLRRSQRLAARCKDGTDIIINGAALRESQRGIEQAEEVKLLTKLVFLFAPLSFVTSIFKMNFVNLSVKQGTLKERSEALGHIASLVIMVKELPNQIDTFGRSGYYWASTESYTESAIGEPTPSGSYDATGQDSGSSESWELVVAEKKIPKMPCYVRKAIDKNRNFVGRSDIIKEIDQALLPNDFNLSSGLRSFSLCGFGGLGKTQIATHYAFARESEFDAIFWVQADELMKLNKSFEDIAKALDLVEEGDQGNKAISRDKVLEWFCDPQKRVIRATTTLTDIDSPLAKWLIIFDNTDDISIVREFWPISSCGSILVTSRDPTAKSDLADQGIDLPPMSSDECAALLQSLVGEVPSATPSQAALSLANRIGHVPLAISQIATRIRRNAMTIEEFLNRHGNNSLLIELNKVQSLPPQEQYRHTLATVWGFENFSPKVQGLIYTMVFMDPDNIAEFILQQDSMDMGSIPYPKPGDEYQRAWEEFYRTSLVQRKKETKSLSWHREVQEVAKNKMTDDQQRKYYEHTIDILSRAWAYTDDPFTRENFKQSACDDVLSHIQSIFRIYKSPLTNFHISTPSAKKLVKLLQEAGWYLVQSAQYDPVLPMFDLALSISQSYGDAMKDLLADTTFSLARYGEETNMNPHKVFEYCNTYHRLSKELNDGSRARVQNLSTSHTSLAQAYLLLDNYGKAAEHCKKCIAIEDDFPDHRSGAWMSQFAHIYLAWAEHGMGNYTKAIMLASKVIDFRMRTFGPDDTESIK